MRYPEAKKPEHERLNALSGFATLGDRTVTEDFSGRFSANLDWIQVQRNSRALSRLPIQFEPQHSRRILHCCLQDWPLPSRRLVSYGRSIQRPLPDLYPRGGILQARFHYFQSHCRRLSGALTESHEVEE